VCGWSEFGEEGGEAVVTQISAVASTHTIAPSLALEVPIPAIVAIVAIVGHSTISRNGEENQTL
jgi:hypothetical protein